MTSTQADASLDLRKDRLSHQFQAMPLSGKFSNSTGGAAILAVLALISGVSSNLSAEKTKAESADTAFEWEAQSISRKLPATAESAEAWFFLTNPATETRKILKIESDCDCITAELDRKQLHPGESAVLVATFHPDTRVGSVSKSIRVISRGKKEAPDTDSLEWNLHIEPPVKIQGMPHNSSDPQQKYRIETGLAPPPRLKVPEGLSGILQLEGTESATRWLLTADLSKQPQAAEKSPLYLIAILPDGLRKHVPLPAAVN